MPDIPLAVTGISKSPTRVNVKARQFDLIVDEPPEGGGQDLGPDPCSYFMAALVGCISITGQLVAKEMGFDIRKIEIEVCSTIDPAKFMGQETPERAGLKAINVKARVDTDADDVVLTEWLAKVESRCPIADNVRSGTPLEVTVVR